MKYLEAIGIEMIIFFAGLAGGIASLTSKPQNMTRKQQFITVLSGGFSANYLTPMVSDLLNLSDKSLYGIAFLLGYSGMKFVEILIKSMNKKITKDE